VIEWSPKLNLIVKPNTLNKTFVACFQVPPYKLAWSSGTVSGANNE
jgi:hypothetical protein